MAMGGKTQEERLAEEAALRVKGTKKAVTKAEPAKPHKTPAKTPPKGKDAV